MGPGPLIFMAVICHDWRVGVGTAEVRPARASARGRAELKREMKSMVATETVGFVIVLVWRASLARRMR